VALITLTGRCGCTFGRGESVGRALASRVRRPPPAEGCTAAHTGDLKNLAMCGFEL
jgi:hypothetical protein